MKTKMGRRIVFVGLCLLFFFASPALAWTPSCSGCCYWDGERCVNGSCTGECKTCSGCNCVDDQSKCTGCQDCSNGNCFDNHNNCPGCQDCSNGNCFDNHNNCPGCQDCSNGSCFDNPDNCNGECHNGCSGGNCIDDQSECTGECETCSGGNCLDDQSKCTGECKTCSGGNCVDDQSECTGECHSGCSGGNCIDDPSECTGECHNGCSGGNCIDDQSECTGECETCSGGNCLDDQSKCTGECKTCSGGNCVDDQSECTGECETCSGGNCLDDQSKCTGECETCSGGNCVDDNSNCPDGYFCVDGKCVPVDDPDNDNSGINDAVGAEPVDLASGEYYFSSQDLFVRGRVLSVEIVRTYSSQRGYDSCFGYGWDMSYNIKALKTTDPNIILLLDGKNHGLQYTLEPGSDPAKYKAPPGRYDFLVENQDGTYTLYKKHGTELDFDADGCVSKILDRYGNTIAFEYDLSDTGAWKKLTTIRDDLNRQISLEYYDQQHADMLWKITDFADRTWVYTYDDANDLREVTGPNTVDYPDGLTTKYTYDGNHNLLTATDPNGQTYLTNTYENDKVTSQDYGYGSYSISYNPDANEATVTDRRDCNSVTVYNATGNPLSRTIYTNGDPPSYTTSYLYNSDMEIERVTFPAGNCVDYNYDANGDVLSICWKPDPNTNDPNITTTFTYDPNYFNFVKTITDPRGNVTGYTYDYDYSDALSFDGAADYIAIPDSNDINLGGPWSDRTISAWFKVNNTTNRQVIWEEGRNWRGLNIYVEDGKVFVGGWNFDPSQSNWTGTWLNTIISANTWHHIVWRLKDGTDTPTADKFKGYLDGTEFASGDGAKLYEHGAGSIGAMIDNSYFHDGPQTGNGYYFNGTIDDVMIFNRALSVSEIQTLYRGGEVSEDGLAAYWKLDDNADDKTVEDSSVNDNRGTATRNTSQMHTDGVVVVGRSVKITFPEVQTPDGTQAPVVRFAYDPFGRIKKVTAPDGIVTKYQYYDDSNPNDPNYGRLWKVIVDANDLDPNCLEITTEFQYDMLGNVIEVNSPSGDITQFAYNDLYQLDQITAASPFNYLTYFSYNKNKKLSEIRRPIADSNQITSYTYDILDHLKTVTDPLSNITVFGYDKNENLADVNDAEENNTHYEYDERDLLWKVTDANGYVTEFSYDENGNLKEIKDAKNNVTKYDYDGFDRLICTTYPDDSNEVFGYDAASNVTSYKNRKGETIEYEYDALNRLKTKTRPSEPTTIFLYDIAGRLVDVNDNRSVSEGGGATRYYYDRIGRVTDVNDPQGHYVGYEYDDLGRRTKLTYPNDKHITYEYDSLSRLTKIKFLGIFTFAEYTYDELSRRTSLTYANGTSIAYDYQDKQEDDNLGNELESVTNTFSGSTTLTFDYTYDDVGNRLTMTVDSNDIHEYKYDMLYQLTDVNYPVANDTTYYYDALGNRTSVVNGGTTTYTLNSKGLNQYGTVGGVNYIYDNNGNLTNINNGQYEYAYDCENRLTDVNNTIGQLASYKYDFAGRRVKKITYDPNGQELATIHYVYDGDQVIAEYDGEGTLLRYFIYGPGIDEPICMITSTAIYYYHYDGLGSVVALSNNSGEIVETYSYDVYGNPSTTSSVGNPYFFTGRRYDEETSLYYYRARYYAPDIGRFLQTDPIGYIAGLNLYAYCGNNPLNWIDPYGFWGEHNNFGRYGGGRFNYNRLDSGWTHPWNPFSTWRHFRDLDNVVLDLMDAIRRGDARDFELHVHELQDYYSHRGAGHDWWSHLWAGDEPDSIYDSEGNIRLEYLQADEVTRFHEDEWDRYNPSIEALAEMAEAWMGQGLLEGKDEIKKGSQL